MCSSSVLTAMTNTNALTTPASARSSVHSKVLLANGMAARLATSTSSDARQTTTERASRGQAEPASAPARYPM